jgi:hypothetical protein
MKFFIALKKLYNYLTEEETPVVYEGSQETTEKQTMIEIKNPYVNQVKEWAVKKIDLLHEADRHKNAKALASEFDEWINISEDTEELDYLCIEDNNWTNEQEIDIR